MANEFKLVSLLNNQVVLTAGPAISAGTQSQNTGTLVFSNSNGVSFGLNNGTITASAVGGAGGGVAISAGTNSTSTGTVVFANSNGVSFGMNTNGVVTGTVQTNYLTTAMASDAGTNFVATSNSTLFQQTSNTSNITSNAMNTSERGNYFYTSNNTFANSTHTHGNLALTAINGTSASNGLSLSAIIPAQTEYVFSNSNGVSFGTNGSTVTATVKTDYLTTAANSTHTHGAIAFSGTNVSGSFTSASNGLSIQLSGGAGAAGNTGYLSAGTTFASLGTVNFGNANGVSFGVDGQTITASVQPAGGVQTGISSLGNSQTTYTSGQVQFLGSNALTVRSTTGQGFVFDAPVQTAFVLSNSNNVSFGTNGSTVTATATFAQSVQTQGMVSVNGSTGNISLVTGSSLSSSQNGSTITFGLASNITTALQSTGNYLTTAAVSNHNHGFSASGGSSTFQTLNFANSNGITFSNSNGSVIASHNGLTTARASNDAIGLNTAGTSVTWTVNSAGISLNAGAYLTTAANSTHSHGNPTLALTNLTGTTASASNGLTISLSAASPGAGGGVVVGNTATTFTSGTVIFRGTNLTVNTSAGQFIDLSVAAPGAAAENNNMALLGANTSGNTTASGSTIGWSGINLTLSGTNNSVINISAPATSSIVGSQGISISTNGSTISFMREIENGFDPFGPGAEVIIGQVGQSSIHFIPIDIPAPIAINAFQNPVHFSGATNSTGSYTISQGFGLYTAVNSTQLSRYSSWEVTTALTHNGTQNSISNVGGYRTWLGTVAAATIPPGCYWMGFLSKTTSGGANASISNWIVSNVNTAMSGGLMATQNATYQYKPFMGSYSAQTAAFPNAVARSEILGSAAVNLRPPTWCMYSL